MADQRKTRIIVLTDISSDRTGYKEPDDTQSLVRLLLYANHFDIEGIVATYTKHWEREVKPEYIKGVIRAYGKARDCLALHDPEFPTEQQLLSTVKCGNPKDGLDQIGTNKDTEASEWIIRRAEAEDDRPLWIAVWGGTTDLAQALWKIRNNRRSQEVARLVSKLRIYSISDQYGIGSWIRDEFPNLFYIVPDKVYRGMYKGGDRSLTTGDWVEKHIRYNHGPLGEAYPNYDGGDLWDKVVGLKEGDSPSFMYLIPNGLGDPEKPEYGCWGGRFTPMPHSPKHYTDAADHSEEGAEPGEWITVSRWREAYQSSFAARMDWCVLPPEQSEREPTAVIKGEQVRRVRPGEVVELDARGSSNSGLGELSFQWSVYREAGSYEGELRLTGKDRPQASVILPETAATGTIHILLEVKNQGKYTLSSYGRVVLELV